MRTIGCLGYTLQYNKSAKLLWIVLCTVAQAYKLSHLGRLPVVNIMFQRVLLLVGLSVLLSACKLAVIVVEGGEVQSVQSGTCMAGAVCIHEINAADFTETFTAVPDPGWYFDGWNAGDGFFCATESGSSCVLNNANLGGNAAVQAIIATDTAFYLLPRFKAATPITDTISVESLEWAQVDLFLDATWAEMNTACPLGTCASGAVLNGYDMTGWTWATLTEIGGLFQATSPHPGGITHFSEIFIVDFQWTNDFFDVLGFRETYSIPSLQARGVSGYASGPSTEGKALIEMFVFPEPYTSANTSGSGTSVSVERNGGWFYRIP